MDKNLENIIEFIQQQLGLADKNFIGVDMGLHSVKIAQIQKGKKQNSYKLVNFDLIPLSEGAFIEDEVQKPEEVVEALKNGLSRSGFAPKNTTIGIAGPNVMSKRIQVPAGTSEEIEDQVMWESEQYIPFDIDESVVTHHILGENQGGGFDVLIAAAKNDVINSYKELAEEAGLKVKIVDLVQYAISNVFEAVHGKKYKGVESNVLLIEFGAQTTNILIFKNGSLNFTRELNVGGSMITEEIQRTMGVNYFEGEDLKISGDSQGNLPEEALEIINITLEAFISEIKKTINFYMTATAEEDFDQCYITGGASLTPGLIEELEGELGLDVSYFNPFESITVDSKKIDDEKLSLAASSGVTAIGLAMRSLG